MHTSPRGSDSKHCHELSTQPQGHHSLRPSRWTSSPPLTAHRNKMRFLALPTLSASSGHKCGYFHTAPDRQWGLLSLLELANAPKSCVPTKGRDTVLPGKDLCSSNDAAETHKQNQGNKFTPQRKHSRSGSKGVLMRVSARHLSRH